MFDLIIHNGRVVDYKNHLDQVTDIAVKDGRIASIGTALGKAKSRAISMQKISLLSRELSTAICMHPPG